MAEVQRSTFSQHLIDNGITDTRTASLFEACDKMVCALSELDFRGLETIARMGGINQMLRDFARMGGMRDSTEYIESKQG